MNFTADVKNRLINLRETQLELFAEVRDMTVLQSGLIEADDIEAFEKSLESRQGLIDKIDGLHQESSVLMQSYTSFVKSKGGKKISGIESANEKLKEIITECARLNEQNMNSAKEKMDEYSKESEKTRKSRESIGLYIQGLSNAPEHFDKMS